MYLSWCMKPALLLTLILTFFFQCTPNREKQDEQRTFELAIFNVNLIDGTGSPLQESVHVYINQNKIISISDSTYEAHSTIDGKGKYLMPGLVDGHTHSADYAVDFPKLMHYGVTSVFIPGGSTCSVEYYTAMRKMGRQDSIPAPRVFHTSQHFTMEGRHPVRTYANSNWIEGETVFFLKDTAQIGEIVDLVAQQPIMGIKLTIEDGPAPPLLERIPMEFVVKTVQEAAKHGLPVYAHASDTEEFLIAVEAGVQNHVHFGAGIDIDWDDSVHVQAVETVKARNGSWVTTLMIDKSFLYPIHPEWLAHPKLLEAYPEDSLLAAVDEAAVARAQFMAELSKSDYGLDTLTLEAIFIPMVEDVRRAYEMGVNMVLGTDTGNDFNFHGYSMHEEMQILEMGGMDPLDIIKMGTLHGARMLGTQDSLGTLEAGKIADMILLNENPLTSINNTLEINRVFKNGKVQKRFSK